MLNLWLVLGITRSRAKLVRLESVISTSGSNSGVTFTPGTKGPVYGVNNASQGVR